MPHGGAIDAAQLKRRFDRRPQTLVAMMAAELKQPDHRFGSVLPSVALHERLPVLVVVGRPASSASPLLQRFAAGERARLVLEYVQVVLQVEDLLVTVVRAGVACDTVALVPDLNVGRCQLDLDRRAGWQWRGVRVGLGLHAPLTIQMAKAHLDQVEAFAGHRQQVLAFDRQCFANALLATIDDALQLFRAGCQQHGLELIQVPRGRHWDEMVAAEEPGFTFDSALLMALARRTELGLKSPMRAEGDKARRLLAPMAAQDFLHGGAKVVVPQPMEYAAQVLEPELVRFKKRLLGRPRIGAMKRRPAGHRAHRKDLYDLPFAIQVCRRFVPIDLAFLTPGVLLPGCTPPDWSAVPWRASARARIAAPWPRQCAPPGALW